MHELDYAYAVANIRANEHRLFTKSDFLEFISASSVDDVIHVLKDKGFGNAGQSFNDEELIKMQNQKIFDYLKDLAKDSDIFDIFVMQNDFHNAKVIIKSKIIGKDNSGLLISPSLVPPAQIESAVNSGDFTTLPEWIKTAAQEAFLAAAQTGDGQRCDIILDVAQMNEMANRAKESKNAFLIGLIDKINALYNLKTAFRACKAKKNSAFVSEALVSCGAFDKKELGLAAADMDELLAFLKNTDFSQAAEDITTSITSFEKYCDNEIIHYLDSAKYSAFGVEPLIAYLFYNEMEQKNIRIILTGKRAGVAKEVMLERIRTYA